MFHIGARILFLIVFLFMISASDQAHALCADPVAEKGSIVFNDSYSTMMFCDGTVWWDMKAGTGGVWFRSSNSDISYTEGSVGVGTSAPDSALHVAGALLLENSGTCDSGGGNKGALRLNAAADALEICDGSGTWLPFTSGSSGGSGSGGGSGGDGTMAEGWPDAIQCSDGTTKTILYYRNLNDSRVAYAPPQVDANPQYILYDKDTGAYFSHSNMDGFDCAANGWSIASIEAGGNAFNFVGGSIWASSSTTINYSSGNVGIGTDTPLSPLHVNGGIRFDAGSLRFPDGTTMSTAASGDSSIYLDESNNLSDLTNAATARSRPYTHKIL